MKICDLFGVRINSVPSQNFEKDRRAPANTQAYLTRIASQTKYLQTVNDVNLATAFTRLNRGESGRDGEHRRGGGPGAQTALAIRNDARFHNMLDEAWINVATDPSWCGPQSLANIAHSLAKLGCGTQLKERRVLAEIAKVAELRVKMFSAREVVNVAWAYATARTGGGSFYACLAEETEARAAELNAQELSIASWAFATAGHASDDLFAALAKESEPKVATFNEQNLSNTAYAFALAGVQAPELFDALARESAGRASELSAQAISNIAWAFATIKHSAPRLFVALASEAERRIASLNTQNIASIVWAFNNARMSHAVPRLYVAVANEVLARLARPNARDQFSPQGIATIMLSCATSLASPGVVFEALSAHAATRLNEFNTQDLANAAGALHAIGASAKAREPLEGSNCFEHDELARCRELWDRVARAAARMEGRLGALGIAALVHVYAKANQKPRELFCAAAREAAGRAHQFSPQQLANVAWSYAKVNVDAPQLFEAIGREAARRADDFKPQELANIVWAFATVGAATTERLCRDLADACVAAATLFKPQELANLIYAVAIAGCWGEAHLVAALERAVVGVPWSEWKVFELRSLALVQYHAKAEAGLELFRDDATFDTVLENARLSADVTVSRTQAEVSQLLGDLGWAHDDEVEVEGVLSVDMADVAARTAVEFDGPSHFVTELETGAVRVGGATLAKTRVLRALGWMVVRLRYDDWQRECEAGTAESFLRGDGEDEELAVVPRVHGGLGEARGRAPRRARGVEPRARPAA